LAIPASNVATHGPRTRGLYWRLYLLILVTLVPMLLIGTFAMWKTARDYRQHSEQRLQETATALARGVDQGVQDNINQLRLISLLLPHANTDSPQLEVWMQQNPGLRLIPDHSPLAQSLPPGLLQAAHSSGNAQISNLFTTDDDAHRVAIALPFVDATGQPHVLSMVQLSRQLINTVLLSGSNDDLLVAVVDGNGVIAARSRNPEAYIGSPATDWQILQQAPGQQGIFPALTQEGQRIIFAFRKLQAAPGWALLVGESQQDFQAGWQRPLFGILAVGLIAALVALFAAHTIAGSILRPIRALAQRGESILANAPTLPDPPASNISEVRSLQLSLNDSVDALKKSADEAGALALELKTKEQRYRTVAEAGALALWEADGDGRVTAVTGWHEITGQEDSAALGKRWLRRVNPQDLPQLQAALAQSFALGTPLDMEFRVLDRHSGWRWLRARGAALGPDKSEWAGVLEDVDARRQAQAHIAFLAHHDALTGLPNRAVLFDKLGHALALAHRGHPSALLLLDLDRFKEVNDTLGHPVGDRLLQEVSHRILGCMRTNDVVARLGGDEFAILMAPEPQPPEAAVILATRLIDVLSHPFELDGRPVSTSTSIGIVLIDKLSGAEDKLMSNADLALYRAKEEGRGCYRFFEEEMDTCMRRRRQLEIELRSAVSEQQFVLYYQPLVDLQQSRLTGFEALLRWQHPQRGLLDPGQFLALAEEIGLMIPIGNWVLQQAMQAACGWPDHLTVAVNLSVSQLAQPNLAGTVELALAISQLPAKRLELEITENALIPNIQAAAVHLLRLKAAGVAIVMDDFGTGYSSLSYLRAFPFDKVKIDKSFIDELDEQSQSSAIIGAVSHLCAKLGIIATIEGVETRAQLAQLKQEQCVEGQGYVFGRPMPLAQVNDFIAQWPQHWPSSDAGTGAAQ